MTTGTVKDGWMDGCMYVASTPARLSDFFFFLFLFLGFRFRVGWGGAGGGRGGWLFNISWPGIGRTYVCWLLKWAVRCSSPTHISHARC